MFDKRDAQAVDGLLHDAEQAKSGYEFAAMLNDNESFKRLKAKAGMLWDKAKFLDPAKKAPAWKHSCLTRRP